MTAAKSPWTARVRRRVTSAPSRAGSARKPSLSSMMSAAWRAKAARDIAAASRRSRAICLTISRGSGGKAARDRRSRTGASPPAAAPAALVRRAMRLAFCRCCSACRCPFTSARRRRFAPALRRRLRHAFEHVFCRFPLRGFGVKRLPHVEHRSPSQAIGRQRRSVWPTELNEHDRGACHEAALAAQPTAAAVGAAVISSRDPSPGGPFLVSRGGSLLASL